MEKTVEVDRQVQTTTVWSFPDRGKWATHSAGYRGNWAPQVARNLILLYSKEGETVLDPMVGSGTTMVEATLLGRKGLGIDIHPEVVAMAKKGVAFKKEDGMIEPKIEKGDARNLVSVEDNSIDFVATHPPYLNIIFYGSKVVDGDLSRISNLQKFCIEIDLVAKECFRVIKPGKYCAILIGDTRRRRHFVPLAFNVMQRFLKAGFILKEDVIKLQHNCSMTRYWSSQTKDFLLIMHEHLFIFRKPTQSEDLSIYKDSIERFS